jgi:hypothetical protein
MATSPAYLLDAIAAQKTLSLRNPGDTDLLNDLGNLLAMAGRLSEAEEVYRRAVELEPANTSSRYNLALVLMEQEENKHAMDELRTVVEIDPAHAWAHYQLGTLEAQRHNRMRALEHYEQAFALDWNLISPAINPHIVENRLATDAMLRAYLSESAAVTAPRLYQQPDEVAELLVPMSPRSESLEQESIQPEIDRPQTFDAAYEVPDESEMPEQEYDEPRVLTESDLQGRAVSPTKEPETTRRKSRPRKNRNSSTYVEPTQPAESASESSPSSEPTRSPTRQPRGLAGSSVTGVGGAQTTPDSGTFFQPGTASTGRLELELLPATSAKQTETPS